VNQKIFRRNFWNLPNQKVPPWAASLSLLQINWFSASFDVRQFKEFLKAGKIFSLAKFATWRDARLLRQWGTVWSLNTAPDQLVFSIF
jgi:hypothetical protein